MTEAATGADAIDQLDGIAEHQSNIKRHGEKGEVNDRIRSIKKSERNVDNRTRRIKCAADAKDFDEIE